MTDVLPPLTEDQVAIAAHATDWRSAVEQAGALLVDSGATTPEYTAAMIRVIEQLGPYCVIAPGLALAHARPSSEVLRNALAVLTLAEPVNFGHSHNDPVSVVLALAVTSVDEHIGQVASLANIFTDETIIPNVAAATSFEELAPYFAPAPS